MIHRRSLSVMSRALPVARTTAVGCCLMLWLAGAACAQRLVAAPDHADGAYRVGETIRWNVHWDGPGVPPSTADYVLKRGGLTEVGKGSLVLTGGTAIVEAKADTVGALLLELRARTPDSRDIRALGGAVTAPEQIAPSAKRPADFDAFWADKVRELHAVPAAPRLEPAEAGRAGVDYWKITMDNIRGTRIQGQVARPSAGQRFPALLIVQWAGVYPLQRGWVTERAAEGWLVLDIEAHDLPIDQPEAFYRQQFAGPLKDYWAIGNDDREMSYFLRMYLSCYRAADYLAGRPDWDGRTLVVMGGSQGGQQSLVTAGLHPKITAALAEVPAGCDMLGVDVGRAPGWPQWYWHTDGKDARKVHEASRYFDVVNFARRIRCPVLIGAGLIDETCPPAGILAAANQIRAPKEVVLLPVGPHQDEYNSHAPYSRRCWGDWLPALRQGRPAPVAQTTAGAVR